MSWSEATLGDFITTTKGYAFKSAWFQSAGVPVVKATNFTDNSICLAGVQRLSVDSAKEFQKYRLSINDVVIQTVGSWPSNPSSMVGKCIRVPKVADGALLNQNTVIIRPNDNLDQTYMYFALKRPDFAAYIATVARGAANQASITLEDIKSYRFPMYDLPTQKRIAGVLSAYDDLIENNRRRIALLEDTARLLYREWFVNFRFPNHEKTKFENGLPEGWKMEELGNHIELIKDSVQPKTLNQTKHILGQNIFHAGHLLFLIGKPLIASPVKNFDFRKTI